MLTTERDKRTCAKYSKRDANGLVHCNDCPLLMDSYNLLCKANAHYNSQDRTWQPDDYPQNSAYDGLGN